MDTTTCGIYEALWLARLHQSDVGSLYVHVPFCVQKCAYCDFASWATAREAPVIGEYVTSLRHMMGQLAEAGLLKGCKTAYVGGGTPTLAGPMLCTLTHEITTCAPRLEELTCEANPDSLSDGLLAELPGAGCTRLSIGVQSLDDQELRTLGRIHTARQAKERVAAAVDAGLRVSCDLMCAIPDQTEEHWIGSLEEVVRLGVGHVSVYPLQIEEGTEFDDRYGDEPQHWNDPSVQATRMETAARILGDAGYARYEVASYARQGEACLHNMSYWTAVPYLGLGTNASSMLTQEGYLRLCALAPQLPKPGRKVARVRLTCTSDRFAFAKAKGLDDLSFSIEMLTEEQAAAEDLMLAMRMVRGADRGLMAHARKTLGEVAVDEALERCAARELVCLREGRWLPTEQGWLLGNELFAELWDLASGDVATYDTRASGA